VKSLRIWLLLLLAVLLPIRGAIAAALPCAGEGPPAHVGVAHATGHAQHHHVGHVSHTGHASPLAHAGDHGDDGKCNLCASCCLGATLPTTFSPAIAALEQAGASFAVLQASAPTFLSDGQERPPRSI
jgi:hypothetical protein